MAVVVKSSQQEETELICGVNTECVVLQPANLEPEPISFVNVNNGMYEAATTISELYNVQPTQSYEQMNSFQNYPSDSQLVGGDVFESVKHEEEEMYEEADDAQPSEHSSSTLSVPVQDYYEIQVAEEEVVSDNWNVDHTEVVVQDLKPRVNPKSEDVEIPLPQDQDLYSQMHPYPCDFCSRRFSKKATLVNHMVSHQMERPHGCNLCGARYRRKFDLVNHMKIHAYPPSRDTLEDDDDYLRSSIQPDGTKGRRKKAQSLAPKRNSGDIGEPLHSKEDKKLTKNNIMKKGKGLQTKSLSYVDEDMRLLSEMSRNSDIANQVPRWPVVDKSRPYVCQHCGVGFARAKALGSHSRIHGGDSPFECDMCGEMFWDVTLLREHTRKKHPQLDAATAVAVASIYTGDDRFGTFYCETCGISFHRLELLKKHRRTHFKMEEPETMQDQIGEEEDEHVCTTCGQFFENASELVTHAEAHLMDSHRCMACGARFIQAAELREHVRLNHSNTNQGGQQSVTCDQCGKVCKDQRALTKHACIHSENRSFPCYSCNKSFHSRARLRRHMVSHRDKAVSCSDCGEEFPDGRALMSHRHSHNTNSAHPARSFPCHDCGKTFGSRSSQQIHVRIHTGERPYGCRFCWKAFADGGTLRKHERIHTGEKPYVCPVCPKAFNQRVVLREHIRAHHSGSDSKVNSYYECKVCGYMFGSSSELCLHLVQHSDENTAKQRAPSMGPRKYKRRRKLGPHLPTKASPTQHHLPASPTLDQLDLESTDSSDSMIEKTRKIIKKKYSYDSPPAPPPPLDLDNDVIKSYENALQSMNSTVTKGQPKKQKMDKLMKKHKTKALSKMTKLARIEKRAKAAKLLNSSSYASKYVVSRPDDVNVVAGQMHPRTKNVTYTVLEDSLDTIFNGSDSFRNRPRTKNVNYHNMKVTKLEPATFPMTKSKNKKPRTKKNFVKKEKTKYGSGSALNGSKRTGNMTYDDTAVSEEKLETCIVDDFNIEGIHNEVKHEDIQIPDFDSVTVKSEVLSCEMCGDEFADRSELLAHIRVHI